MKKGDILLIPFPFTDLSGIKNRPALLLAQSERDVIVAFITTQLKWEDDHHIVIQPSHESGIKKTSLLRLDKLTTINKELIIGKLGNLSSSELRSVDIKLLQLFKIELP